MEIRKVMSGSNSNDNNNNKEEQQFHFVLVHGAGHGGWCWYKIRTLLEAAGHKVTCPDLKCSGIDPTDFNTVFSFADYNQPLTSFISSLPPNHKVIVVGHSAGGKSVTDVILKFADKVHIAVYVAAIMINIGNSASTNEHLSKQLGDANAYELIYGLGLDQPPTGIMVKPELRRQLLYNESPLEEVLFVEEAKKKFQAIQQAYSVLSDENKRFMYDVGVYDSDDDESGMGDFLSEMAVMMSQTKPNQESGEETFEELQQLFEDMFQGNSDAFGSSNSTSYCETSTTSSTSYASYNCESSSSSNKRSSTDMNNGIRTNGNDSSSGFAAHLQSFCVGVS